jgi:hypothetical protein
MSVNPDVVERTRRIVASAEQKVLLKRLAQLSKKMAGEELPATHTDLVKMD